MNFQQLEDHFENSVTFWRRKLSADLILSRDLIIRGIRTGKFTTRTQNIPRAAMIRRTINQMMQSGNENGRRKMRSLSRGKKKLARFQEAFEPQHAIKVLRDKAFLISGVLESGLVNDVRNVMILGLRNGEGISDISSQVVNIFAPYVGDRRKLEDGRSISPHRAETIVRTNYTEAFNSGILNESAEIDPGGDFIEGFEFSAILDTRTTEVCTHLDTRIFRPDDPSLSRLQPPRHFNCRSILVPVFIDEEINEEDLVTPTIVARGLELSDVGFGRPGVRKTPTVGATAPVK